MLVSANATKTFKICKVVIITYVQVVMKSIRFKMIQSIAKCYALFLLAFLFTKVFDNRQKAYSRA